MEKFPTKIFAILFISIFTAVTGVGIVVPLLPIYARDLGASGIYIGLIFGGFSLSRSFFLPWFGRLSDARGRKPFLVYGLFFYFLISICFIFAHNVFALIGVRLVQGVASAMIMPVAQAYVGDITPEGKEGFVMGLFNMSTFTGLSIGPLFGGVINDKLGLNFAFGSMGVLAFSAFCLSLVMLPPVSAEKIAAIGKAPVKWSLILADKILVGLIGFRFVYTTCIGIIWGFLPLYADVNFHLSGSAIGLLVMLGVSVSGIFNIPMGYVADRCNKKGMVIIGGIVVIGAMLLMGRAQGFYGLFMANVVFGLGGGISMPALMGMAVVRGNRVKAMGSVMALITIAHSLGMMTGAFLAGAIMDILELRYAFYLGTLVMGAGILQFWISTRKVSAH